MNDSYEIHILDPAEVEFIRSEGGVLTMKVGSESSVHPEVLLFRTYPLSKQTQFISVRTPKGDEIGILEDIGELNPESRLEAERELKFRYMTPNVTRIGQIKNNPGMWVWHLETNYGPLKMSMRNLHEHVLSVGENRLILTDIDGNRCEITDILQLDAHSQKQLFHIL